MKKSRPSAASPDAAQRQRFIETAKELGCDQDEQAFRKKLGEIAKAKPKSDAE